MDEEEYHLQSKFYYPKDLETSEAGISEIQEAIDDFINKQQRETSTDMNTLLHFIEANGLNSQTIIESLPASELDHLLSIFFYERTQEK